MVETFLQRTLTDEKPTYYGCLLNVTVYGKYLYVYMCHQTPNRVILMKRDTHSQVKVGAQGLGDKRISLSIVVVDDHSVICKCKSGNAFTGG